MGISDSLREIKDTLRSTCEFIREYNRKSEEERLKQTERDNISSESMGGSAEVLNVDSEPLRQNDQATIEKSKCMRIDLIECG